MSQFKNKQINYKKSSIVEYRGEKRCFEKKQTKELGGTA